MGIVRRHISNGEIARRLPESQAKMAEIADFVVAYADEDRLREYGFSDDSIDTIEQIRQEVNDYDELEKVNGIGPKTAERIYNKFGITTVDELSGIAGSGALSRVEGVGSETAKHIQKSIQWVDEGRLDYEEAYEIVVAVHEELGDYFDNLTAVGSFRRSEPTIGDIDMLGIPSQDIATGMVQKQFKEMVDYVIRCGDNKMTGRFMETQVDIQVVTEDEWPAAIQYFTGSQDHNVEMRVHAKNEGWKLNEYGLWDRETEERIPVDSERDLYEKVKGTYVEPEER